MLIIHQCVKHIINSCLSSVTASVQSGSKKALRLGSLGLLIFSGPALFSAPSINGVIDGNTPAERAIDARYERIYALWGALVTVAEGQEPTSALECAGSAGIYRERSSG